MCNILYAPLPSSPVLTGVWIREILDRYNPSLSIGRCGFSVLFTVICAQRDWLLGRRFFERCMSPVGGSIFLDSLHLSSREDFNYVDVVEYIVSGFHYGLCETTQAVWKNYTTQSVSDRLWSTEGYRVVDCFTRDNSRNGEFCCQTVRKYARTITNTKLAKIGLCDAELSGCEGFVIANVLLWLCQGRYDIVRWEYFGVHSKKLASSQINLLYGAIQKFKLTNKITKRLKTYETENPINSPIIRKGRSRVLRGKCKQTSSNWSPQPGGILPPLAWQILLGVIR